jgi:ATP-binding cassette subfamily F protein uup
VTSTLVFEGEGVLNEYVGGYTDWLRQRRAISTSTKSGAKPRNAAAPAAAVRAAAPPVKARKLSYKDQRELEAMPSTIQRLEAEQSDLTGKIADRALFRRSPAEAAAAAQRLQVVQQELETAFARWESLEAATPA